MIVNKLKNTVNNEKGAAMLITMMMLIVLTIIGMAANNTSIFEIKIAGSSKNQKAAFYAAEAGIEHAKVFLQDYFDKNKRAWFYDPYDVEENFFDCNPETENCNPVPELENQALGKYTYTVTAWLSAQDSQEIFIRSEAQSIDGNGGRSIIQIVNWGGFGKGMAITGYKAQSGAGAGKNFNANDANSINDFNQQI